MKKIVRFSCLFLITMLLAFAFSACGGSKAEQSDAHAATPASSNAAQHTDEYDAGYDAGYEAGYDAGYAAGRKARSDASQSSANSSGNAGDDDGESSSYAGSNSASGSSNANAGASAKVNENDDSYAQSHLNGDDYATPNITVEKNGTYTDKDHVALYIHKFGTVPSNYVTKSKARKAGWVNTKGNLWDVLPGKSIGGGGFSNDDNTMPDAPGREWFECDIDYEGGFRNAKRLVYSDDGLIYYTDDHYKTFTRLY